MSAAARNTGRLAAWRAILVAGIPRRAVWWAVLGSIGVGLAIMALTYLSSGRWRPLALGVTATLGALALWLTLVYGLLMQNDPTIARTVPRHLVRLREVAALSWVAMTAWVAAMWWLAGIPPFHPLLFSSLFLAALAVSARWAVGWLLIFAIPVLPGRLLAEAVSQASFTQQWLGSAAIVVAGAVLCAVLLGSGDARHRRAHARRRAWRRAVVDEQVRPGTVAGSSLGRITEWLRRPYHRLFDLAVSRPASAWRRLILGLGPHVHPAEHVAWAGLVLGLLVAAAFTVAIVWPELTPSGMSLFGPLLGAWSTGFSPVGGTLGGLASTRREQALLMLLPGMPRGAALNRGLALRLWCRFGVAWAMVSLLSLAAVAWFAPDLKTEAAVAVASLLPTVGLLGIDLSRMPVRSANVLARWLLMTFACPGVALLLHVTLGLGAAWVAGGFVLASVGLLAWRWHALGHTPQALPAGRLAV
jgi:hypothetical protein